MEEWALKISDVITPPLVDLNVRTITNKNYLFRHMLSLLHKADVIDSQKIFLTAIYERESLGPTYMGNFIAIPHGKSSTVKKTGIAFCRCDDGFFYETEGGGGPVKLAFMLAVPEQMSGNEYIQMLARLARLLVYPEFVEALYKADDYVDVIKAIQECEILLE